MDESHEPLRLHVSGLLDLQNALNDLEEVADAFREWSGDPGLSPIDVLIGKGPVNSHRLELIEGLAELLLERQGGDPLKPPSYFGADRLSSASSSISDSPGESSIDVGSRFRVIRHHAEGGLGSVSVAIDKELNREVALKQILDRHADNEARRARFLVEAEITGGLEHPGIVPVYSLGHSADGRPFYAMRFIRGETLADAITRFHAQPADKVDPGTWSLELRKLLRRFIDVCNAMEYAHSRGILHRDLKPSNVMVGKHGETLVVDWGLAKTIQTDESGADDEGPLTPSSGGGETLPGSAVGTPSFMSPEQAAGAKGTIGPASDVYSLGATLFCLLTGRPAFHSDDPQRTLKEVQAGTFPTPRNANALVPRPLEAICLKAMVREPGQRYQSARALADDIERWMADEPVSAYSEPLGDRARRWARRRRSAVTSAVAALLVALVGLGVVLIVQARANDQLQQANGREKQFNLLLKDGIKREVRANRELQAANERVAAINKNLRTGNEREHNRFDLALDAIRLFHSEVSDDFLLKETEFSGLRANLLRGALDFYAKLLRQLEDHPDRSSREAIARVYGQLAELEANVGTSKDALSASRSALQFRRQLAKEMPGDLRGRADLASGLVSLGILTRNLGNREEALSSLEEARTILEDVVRLGPSNVEFGHDPAGRLPLRDRRGAAMDRRESRGVGGLRPLAANPRAPGARRSNFFRFLDGPGDHAPAARLSCKFRAGSREKPSNRSPGPCRSSRGW